MDRYSFDVHASASRNPLARALQVYGRLVKTNFVLAWRADKQLERRVTRQLNKGEALQALRRYLFFAREGQPRHRHLDGHGDQALCLTLVVNAVLTWNTVYTQAALDQLAAEGHVLSNTDLAHFSPLQHAHINPYGRYSFDLARRPASCDRSGPRVRRSLRPPVRSPLTLSVQIRALLRASLVASVIGGASSPPCSPAARAAASAAPA